jgi:taurine dioxygenase
MRAGCTIIGELMDIQPISPALGATVQGVDLVKELSDAPDPKTVSLIRGALATYGVLAFPDQHINDEQHKQIARAFGEIFVHPNFNTGVDDPELVWIVREPGDTRIVGEHWHTDTTMMKSPPMGALLYAVECPRVGGDTLFSSQWQAYAALSDGLKAAISSLWCVHSDRKVAGPQAALNSRRATRVREDADWRPTENIHPVVRLHPESGLPCLFVNHSYSIRFDGWTEAESAALLNYLLNWGNRPEFTCRIRWQPGTLVFWDNRSTKHIAVNDVPDGRRVMRRVQVCGDVVQALGVVANP